LTTLLTVTNAVFDSTHCAKREFGCGTEEEEEEEEEEILFCQTNKHRPN